jgi:molybdopterin/thiamine biosynthesis adenylyltransferase
MRYILTILQEDYERLLSVLFENDSAEHAAYLTCRLSASESEHALLVRQIIPVAAEHIFSSSATHMTISSRSFTSAMKKASDRKECFVFAHSHPPGCPDHSPQDDEEEQKLFRTAYTRIRTPGVHASLVFCEGKLTAARIWLPDGSLAPMERVRIIGDRFRFLFFDQQTDEPVPEFFDRQVRAFGSDIQKLLRRLRIGVVGVGGTGSSVSEQLIRLGVGALTIADGEVFQSSNVNRVYGSRLIDNGIAKVKLIERMAADIGVDTDVVFLDKPISFESVLRAFRHCDVIFGCTDDEWGRSLLTRLAIYYGVPVFDMGIKVDSEDGTIRTVQGRVTTLLPGTACLFCRGRVSSDQIAAESARALDPEGAAELEREGYIPELRATAPAVIPFTTTVAASAITEFLHRLTGFLGSDRRSSEVLHLIDDGRIRTNARSSREDCFCADRTLWDRGDVNPFLDLTWRTE